MVVEPKYHTYHALIPEQGGLRTFVCEACGSLILDKHLHDEWHDYMVCLLVYRDE